MIHWDYEKFEMKILAIETSTDACSCALWLNEEIREQFVLAPRSHGTLILSMVDELLREGGLGLKELDGLAFGCGPGAFTGLRIAAGVVQGLAFAAELPVVAISSLAALAQATRNYSPHGEIGEQILAIQDARMGEVYHGAFRRGSDFLVRVVGAVSVCRPEQVTLPPGDGGWIIVGSGWGTHGTVLIQSLTGSAITILSELLYPRAGDVARLAVSELAAGRGMPAEQALPVYLRQLSLKMCA
ncbi:tRNA threonylcarbamoyladenosine biosynthesis protein TsaB [Gammaproteobacteria bacterium]